MAKVISLIQQKGGVGKTTAAINIATTIAMRKKSVLLIDADPQGSAQDWASMTDKTLFPTIGLSGNGINEQVKMLSGNYDYIVIDGSPRIEKGLISVIKASDLCILPCMPSPVDIWAADKVVEFISAYQEINPKLNARFLINGVNSRSKIQDSIGSALNDYNIPVLDTVLCARDEYKRVMNDGISVIHSNNTKAIAEIEKLTTEVLHASE